MNNEHIFFWNDHKIWYRGILDPEYHCLGLLVSQED
jgi:hypothetical protein